MQEPAGAQRCSRRVRRAERHSQAADPTAAEMPDDLTRAPAADYSIPGAGTAAAAVVVAAAGVKPTLNRGCAVGLKCWHGWGTVQDIHLGLWLAHIAFLLIAVSAEFGSQPW